MIAKHIVASILAFCIFLLLSEEGFSQDSTIQKYNLSSRRERIQARRNRVNKLIEQEEDGALVFAKQWALGVKLNTDGYGFFYEHGKYKTIKKTNLWWLELGEKKQHNQQKVTPEPQQYNIGSNTEVLSVGDNYVYGKENNFYQFKIGLGRQLLIGGKGSTNGVAVSAIYGGGISFGIVKPYYLQVEDSLSQSGVSDVRYQDKPDVFLNPLLVLGASGFTKGWDKATVVPGLHVRGALRFDYGRFRETLSALEVGFNVDYYAKKVGIMVLNPKHDLFLNTYIAFVFGGRK